MRGVFLVFLLIPCFFFLQTANQRAHCQFNTIILRQESLVCDVLRVSKCNKPFSCEHRTASAPVQPARLLRPSLLPSFPFCYSSSTAAVFPAKTHITQVMFDSSQVWTVLCSVMCECVIQWVRRTILSDLIYPSTLWFLQVAMTCSQPYRPLTKELYSSCAAGAAKQKAFAHHLHKRIMANQRANYDKTKMHIYLAVLSVSFNKKIVCILGF